MDWVTDEELEQLVDMMRHSGRTMIEAWQLLPLYNAELACMSFLTLFLAITGNHFETFKSRQAAQTCMRVSARRCLQEDVCMTSTSTRHLARCVVDNDVNVGIALPRLY